MPISNETTPLLAARDQSLGARRPTGAQARAAVVNPLVALAVRLARAITADFAVRRSIRRLSGLSDYGLHDIGLTRGDVDRVVRPGRF